MAKGKKSKVRGKAKGKKSKRKASVGVDGVKKFRRRNAPPKRKRGAKKKPFNEKNALAEFAAALDEDKDDFHVTRRDWPGDHFELSTSQREYHVYKDDDAAHEAAIVVVKQDLEQEPEMFNQSFIESHIDEKKFSEWVYDAVMEDEYAQELANDDHERFWEEASRWGVNVPDEDDEDYEEVPDDAVEEMKEAMAKDRAKDPMGWLEDIYGKEDAVKKAIEVAGIDIEVAADDAVSTDGWPHFLARYDGNYEVTPSGFVYFRVN